MPQIVIGVSFSSDQAMNEGIAENVLQRCRRAIKKISPHCHIVETTPQQNDCVLMSSKSVCWADNKHGESCWLAGNHALNLNLARVWDSQCLLENLLESGEPDWAIAQQLAAPWGAVVMSHHRIHGLTDSAGLFHIFYYQGEGFAIVANSAVAIGYVARLEMDPLGLGTFARIGNYLGQQTVLKGVSKLNRGCRVCLVQGNLVVEPYLTQGEPQPLFPDRQTACREGVAVLSKIAGQMLAACPECGLELSGGLDSRILLALIPPEQRHLHPALTLGNPGKMDWRIADQITQVWEIPSIRVDLGQMEDLSCEVLKPLVEQSALNNGYLSNPYAQAVLAWVNQQTTTGSRLSGQNGEFARGFYYGGQSEHPTATPQLLEQLLRWRLTTNQCVPDSLFEQSFLKSLHDHISATLSELFSTYPGSWLAQTDEFYLDARMQRWVGADYSHAQTERLVLAPFFQPEFIVWARRLRPEWKKGGVVLNQVLCELDPRLADVSLNGGPSPLQLRDGSWWVGVHQKMTFVKKVGMKISQKMLGTGKAPVGAEGIYRRCLANQSSLENRMRHLEDVGWLNHTTVSAWLANPPADDWITSGFLFCADRIRGFLSD